MSAARATELRRRTTLPGRGRVPVRRYRHRPGPARSCAPIPGCSTHSDRSTVARVTSSRCCMAICSLEQEYTTRPPGSRPMRTARSRRLPPWRPARRQLTQTFPAPSFSAGRAPCRGRGSRKSCRSAPAPSRRPFRARAGWRDTPHRSVRSAAGRRRGRRGRRAAAREPWFTGRVGCDSHGVGPPGYGGNWRRERDSNPRWAFGPYALSRGAPSTTRPSLRHAAKPGGRDHTGPRDGGSKPRATRRGWEPGAAAAPATPPAPAQRAWRRR